MAAFQYSQYRNPYVGSISDLMMRPADAQAAAAERIGAIQAQAAQQSGQAYAGAANQIGQSVAAIPGEMERQKFQQLQQQNLQGQISDRAAQQQQRDRDNAAAAAGSAAIKASIGPDGKIDHQKAADEWAKAGFPVAANAYLESTQKTSLTAQQLDEGRQKIEAGKKQIQEAAVNHMGESALVGLNKLKDQTPLEARDSFMGLIANQAAHGLISEDDAHQALMQTAAAGPDQLAAIYKHYVDLAPAVKEKALKDQLTQSEIAKNEALAKKDAEGPKPPNAQSESFLLDGKPVKGAFLPDPEGGKYLYNGEDVTARAKPIPPASMTINPAMVPSGDALDMAAKKYLATGDLPSMGMGQAGVAARIAVMNRAAAIDPQASLAANKATYGADSKNLANLQRTEGTLSAFEKTAGKNLDQFLSLADKIPDTGVPWLNAPLRSVNTSGLGSADQAAFNAARDVALREIARVTNDPKLSGVLSDAARKEVSGLSAKDATFAQIQAVAKVLKQDMANVHAGINEQIGLVKSGLQSNPSAAAQPTQPTAPVAEEWIRVNGKLVKKGG